MSDIVEKARTARTNLAEALSLLQSPEAGSLIDSVAEPVARAMGALHQLETSGGKDVGTKAPLARDAVREALATLQTAAQTPTAERVTEIIAGSLGLLHSLAQVDEVPKTAVSSTATTERQSAFDKTQLPSEPIDPSALARTAPVGQPSVAAHSKKPAPAAPAGALDMTMPTPPTSPHHKTTSELASTKASVQSPDQDNARKSPSRAPQAERRDSKHASMPPDASAEGALYAEANLGAHSPTNFYKGLSGNDVVDDGGLFVSTYEIPPLGAKLQLTVNMPGGYDFRALAVVKWARESGVGDAPPGFGCAFVSISQEARQLIYRYVRNREPLFHDDF